MENQMRLIIELQGIDGQIRELKAEIDREPDRLKELRDDMEAKQELLHETVGELKAIKAESKDLELSIEDLRSRLKESNARLNKVKTEREAKALHKEIADTDAMIKEREARVVELKESIEGLAQKEKDTTGAVDQEKKEVGKEKKRLDKERKHYDKLFSQLAKQREKLASKLDPELRTRYDFLLTRRDGVAVATVKDGVCLQCYMNIPPQMFIMLQRAMKVETCPNCGRLIYWIGHE